jgi:predicted secreted protein
MTQRLTLIVLLCVIAAVAYTGDIATFENLGFSADSEVFVFGQYGLQAESAEPFAEIYAVDVSANQFLPSGVFSTSSSQSIALGQDGSGAFFNLLRDATPLLRSENIDHLATGRPIYLLLGDASNNGRLSFRDFNTDVRYDIRLTQDQRGSGEDVSAAFFVEVTITSDVNRARTFTIGRPGYYRPGIASYQITQVLLAPDDSGLVIVVQQEGPDGSIRYMVETARL